MSNSNVVKMSDWVYKWKTVFEHDGESKAMFISQNMGTGELSFDIQDSVDGRTTSISLSTVDSACLREALNSAHEKIGK